MKSWSYIIQELFVNLEIESEHWIMNMKIISTQMSNGKISEQQWLNKTSSDLTCH